MADDLATRLTRLEDQMSNLAEDVRGLVAEVITGDVGGNRRSVRTRLHDLEGARAAQHAAESALSAVKAERRAQSAATLSRGMLFLTAINVAAAIVMGALALLASTGNL